MTNHNHGSTSDTIKDTLHSIGDAATRVSDRVSDTTSDMGKKASAFGQSAVSAIDATRAPLANGIKSAASTLHSGADSLEDTAKYLRKNKLSDMLGDVGGALKAYPTAALIGAVVIGFAAGRILRRG
jgi:ABC-type transporter Mla subunit MlaD